ncbi:rhodanese-like domain-containing protein [Thalassotalea agarivorans]|uniref:Rhodanese-related sulfurtransferase n=1 Tax=Thalassotalea agarivorans TaxID=349064 RepID=A0A1I0HQ81_THASX|nr:rhodanese-like domain-containing protein [Thalassotalea agarivorans]SET86171.1 Rhodanese-related sulfurtransferase [Thalassotalea agarivorans]
MNELMIFAGNHPILSTVWVVLVLMIIVTSVQIKMSPVKQYSPQELTFAVNKEDAVVVDIRSENEFNKGRIIDAKHLGTDKANKNEFASLEKFKDRPIIVVCNAGISAQKVAAQLFKAGFTKAGLLKGGMNAWLNASLPVTKK